MSHTNSEVLVILTAIPGLEEALVDWLISRPGSAGFTSVPVHGHGARHNALSPLEQVAGRQKRVQFQVMLVHEELREFLDSARAEFGGADLHYWVLPVLDSGGFSGV